VSQRRPRTLRRSAPDRTRCTPNEGQGRRSRNAGTRCLPYFGKVSAWRARQRAGLGRFGKRQMRVLAPRSLRAVPNRQTATVCIWCSPKIPKPLSFELDGDHELRTPEPLGCGRYRRRLVHPSALPCRFRNGRAPAVTEPPTGQRPRRVAHRHSSRVEEVARVGCVVSDGPCG
jgi:hypothetical protein